MAGSCIPSFIASEATSPLTVTHRRCGPSLLTIYESRGLGEFDIVLRATCYVLRFFGFRVLSSEFRWTVPDSCYKISIVKIALEIIRENQQDFIRKWNEWFDCSFLILHSTLKTSIPYPQSPISYIPCRLSIVVSRLSFVVRISPQAFRSPLSALRSLPLP